MYKIRLDQDIQPLFKFRSKVVFHFDKVEQTKRPLIITQNGKSSVILLNVSAYQSLIDKLEVLGDIKLAEEHINNGIEIAHQEVKMRVAKKSKL